MFSAGMFFYRPLGITLFFILSLAMGTTTYGQASSLLGLNGDTLEYMPFAMRGQSNEVNIIPDYSHAGYMGGGVALPEIPTVISLSPSDGDDTERIQEAIDQVEAMNPDAEGIRGAVLLRSGCYDVAGRLFIEKSGVVLRGEGQGLDGTVLHANLREKHDFITLRGEGGGFDRLSSTRQDITTPYVSLGSYSFSIADASDYAVGDTIVLRRTPNQFWIDDLGMDEIGWTTSSYAIFHERVITSISGDTLTINIPIVDVIEDQYGGGEVYKASVPGRISQCGIEHLRIRSYYEENNSSDEDHAWIGIKLSRTTHSWVKNVTGQFLGYGTVSIHDESNFNTIQDCANIDPVSRVRGGRRYSFNISDGMGNLFQRNYTMLGRHDFVTGSRVTGPNVFLDNFSAETFSDIGPHHRWATGILFDNVRGGGIRVRDRGTSGSGHGWAGNATMFWNIVSYTEDITVESPPGGINWGIGCRGIEQKGDGFWEKWDTVVQPRSLYLQQLQDRLGPDAVAHIATPEQLNGDIYDRLENWSGGGGFKQPDFDAMLYLTEDSYVRGGEHSNTNFGSSSRLNIKNTGEGSRNDRKTFLKIDLSTLPTPIYDVTLRLKVSREAPNPTIDVVHYVADNGWSEDAITYENQPQVGALIDTAKVLDFGAWVEFDLTDAVLAEMETDSVLSLRITASVQGGNLHRFYSRNNQNTSLVPHLAYNLTPGGSSESDYCDRTTTSTDLPDYETTSESPSFTVMPNPVREELRFVFSQPDPADNIYIYSTTGSLIRKQKKPKNASSLRIFVADLPAGMYLIRVGRETQKFIKM